MDRVVHDDEDDSGIFERVREPCEQEHGYVVVPESKWEKKNQTMYLPQGLSTYGLPVEKHEIPFAKNDEKSVNELE